MLQSPFAERAGELGLAEAELRYEGEPLLARARARLDRDIDRGVTGLGPHLDDIVLAAGSRELRSFGSQGEQRLAMLALLLAEAELITDGAASRRCCCSTTSSPSSTPAAGAFSRPVWPAPARR